jgi:hypothetical protein
VQQLIDRFSKRVDRRADAFEIYLARNIFNVPEGTRESAGQVRRREGSTEEGREERKARAECGEEASCCAGQRCGALGLRLSNQREG